jgi:hypothetical protein
VSPRSRAADLAFLPLTGAGPTPSFGPRSEMGEVPRAAPSSRRLVRRASASTRGSRSGMSAARGTSRAAPLSLGRRLRPLRSLRTRLRAAHVRLGCPRVTLRASRPPLRASADLHRARSRLAFACSTLFRSREIPHDCSPKLLGASHAFLGASQETMRASRTSIGASRTSIRSSSVLMSDAPVVLFASRRVLSDAPPIG